MKEIPLTRGLVAQIDDEDFLPVSQHKWCAKKGRYTFYAHTSVRKADGTRTCLQMHTLLLPDAKMVDHEDGNGLNNQRHNIRPSNAQQNCANSRKYKNGITSQYRGVCWCKRTGKFLTQIQVNKKNIHLGYFTSGDEAARAYDAAALEHFGEFARLNFTERKAA